MDIYLLGRLSSAEAQDPIMVMVVVMGFANRDWEDPSPPQLKPFRSSDCPQARVRS